MHDSIQKKAPLHMASSSSSAESLKRQPASEPSPIRVVKQARNLQSPNEVLARQNEFRMLIVELERTLFALNRLQDEGSDETWHSLQFRVDKCLSLWKRLESFVHPQEGEKPDIPPRVSLDVIGDLKRRVDQTCAKLSVTISERKENDPSDALIHRVFFARVEQQQQQASTSLRRDSNDAEEEGIDSSSSTLDVIDLPQNRPRHTGATSKSAQHGMNSNPLNIADLQKKQREQVEEAISLMASQLKAETERINETLRVHNHELDELENIATDNVDKVTKVANDVKEQVESSWRKSVGTWTFFFTMVGVFVFMLVMIQIAPKGKGCILFCAPKPRPNEYCRTLPTGRLECIPMENDPQPAIQKVPINSIGRNDQEIETKNAIDREEMPLIDETKELCEVDAYGECLPIKPTRDDAKLTMSNKTKPENSQKMRKKKKKKKVELQDGEENIPPKKMRRRKMKKKKKDPLLDTTSHKEEASPQKEEETNAKVELSVTDDDIFGLYMVEAEADGSASEGSRPILHRNSFTPREIRNAANFGDFALLKGYLSVKPEWVNKADENGWSALHLAVRRGDLRSIHFLLEAGADLSLRTVDGRTARDIAVTIYEEGHSVVNALNIG